MSLDREDAERIARELIAEIASKWEDTSRIVCVKDQHDAHIFVFPLPPAPLMRNGVLIERPAAFSTFHFHPLAEATEIVARCDFDLGQITEKNAKDKYLRQNAKERINQMLLSAADIFSDAMWEARITAETLSRLKNINLVGKFNVARKKINETVDLISERARKRFGTVSKSRSLRINQVTIALALNKFFRKFKESGELPSQRQFAKAIGVTPKAWRTFLKNHDLEEHEVTIKQWYEYLVAVGSADQTD